MINNVATGKVVCVIPMPNDGAEIERKRAWICREGVFVLYVRWGINNFVIYIYIHVGGFIQRSVTDNVIHCFEENSLHRFTHFYLLLS